MVRISYYNFDNVIIAVIISMLCACYSYTVLSFNF